MTTPSDLQRQQYLHWIDTALHNQLGCDGTFRHQWHNKHLGGEETTCAFRPYTTKIYPYFDGETLAAETPER